MKLLSVIVQEVTGLFIDDGMLALGILIVAGLAAITELLMADTRLAGGAILLLGCLGVLLLNVLKAGRE